MTGVHRIVALALLVIPAVSCTAPAREVGVGEQDQGKTIELGVGDTLTVRLPGNPTTGFSWEVAVPPAPVLVQVGEREQERVTTGLVGAPSTTVFRFRAATGGEVTLSLRYRRPWETVPPERTFEIRARVR